MGTDWAIPARPGPGHDGGAGRRAMAGVDRQETAHPTATRMPRNGPIRILHRPPSAGRTRGGVDRGATYIPRAPPRGNDSLMLRTADLDYELPRN